MLPDAGYQFQLGKEVTDSTLWEERDKLTKFISTLSQSGEVTTTQEQKVLTMENVSLQKFVKKKKRNIFLSAIMLNAARSTYGYL